MAKYELTNEQVQQLKNILANAQIRGSDAPIILRLHQALSMPIPVKEKKDAAGKEKPINKGKTGGD